MLKMAPPCPKPELAEFWLKVELMTVRFAGPKMAELAGRVGDGLNTQAGHPRLGDLVAVARESRSKAGGVPARFVVTVFAGLAERWLRRDSPERERLSALGVDRLILLVGPPYVDDIQRAGRLLAAPT